MHTCHFSVPGKPDLLMLHPQIHSSHQIGNRCEPGLLFTPLQKEVLVLDWQITWLQAKLQLVILRLTRSYLVHRSQWLGFFLPFLLLSSLIVATAGMILAPIMANAIKVILEDWGIIHLKTSSQNMAWMVMILLQHLFKRKLVTRKTKSTFFDVTNTQCKKTFTRIQSILPFWFQLVRPFYWFIVENTHKITCYEHRLSE